IRNIFKQQLSFHLIIIVLVHASFDYFTQNVIYITITPSRKTSAVFSPKRPYLTNQTNQVLVCLYLGEQLMQVVQMPRVITDVIRKIVIAHGKHLVNECPFKRLHFDSERL